MFLGMGAPELIVILIVVLVIFGPKNLPKLGNPLGKTVKSVREGMESEDDSKGKDDKPEEVASEDADVEDVKESK